MEQITEEFSLGLFGLQILALIFLIVLGYFVYKIYKKIK